MLSGRTARAVGLAAALVAGAAVARGEDDQFIRGYAAAVLQRDFNLAADAVSVSAGVVTVRAELSDQERERLTTALTQISGVQRVVVTQAEPVPEVTTPEEPSRWAWLPRRELFQPLIADPRWPRFAASYQYYIDEDALTSVAAVSFGETFPLLQYDFGPNGTLQFGIQGSVFAIFDLASDSFDLVNADYFGALPISYALGNFSAMFRVYHQSSHLGDEFLLETHPRRVNLSYEALDLLFSYELGHGLRAYGGGGYIFDADPSDLGRGLLQAGGEYIGEPFDWGFPIRPVAALDIQINEQGGWAPNFSPNLGLQFGTGRGEQRSLRLLLQYYNGQSPNGQFYNHHIQYIGLGAQLDF